MYICRAIQQPLLRFHSSKVSIYNLKWRKAQLKNARPRISKAPIIHLFLLLFFSNNYGRASFYIFAAICFLFSKISIVRNMLLSCSVCCYARVVFVELISYMKWKSTWTLHAHKMIMGLNILQALKALSQRLTSSLLNSPFAEYYISSGLNVHEVMDFFIWHDHVRFTCVITKRIRDPNVVNLTSFYGECAVELSYQARVFP